MPRIKVLPTNILISSLVMTAAIVSLYAVYGHNVPAGSTPVFYDEPVVVVRTTPAVNEAVKTEVYPNTLVGVKPVIIPTQTVPPVLMPPKVISRILPEFPFSAVEKGIQGTVVLSVYVDPKGRPERTVIKTSSGFEALDESSVKAVSQWKFAPAIRGGQAIGSWFEIPVMFRIK